MIRSPSASPEMISASLDVVWPTSTIRRTALPSSSMNSTQSSPSRNGARRATREEEQGLRQRQHTLRMPSAAHRTKQSSCRLSIAEPVAANRVLQTARSRHVTFLAIYPKHASADIVTFRKDATDQDIATSRRCPCLRVCTEQAAPSVHSNSIRPIRRQRHRSTRRRSDADYVYLRLILPGVYL